MITPKPRTRGLPERSASLGLLVFLLVQGCGPAAIDRPSQGNSRGNSPTTQAAPVDGAAIIDRLRETYWSCQTYRDRGELTLTYGLPGQQQSRQWSFSTVFRQPQLRFAFGQGPGIPVMPSDRKLPHCAWDGDDSSPSGPEMPSPGGLEMRQSLSLDTMGTVPALLAADQVGPGWWTTCSSFHVTGHEDLNGSPCLVVDAASRPPVTTVTLWIDQEQFVLRRKEVEFTIGADGSRGRQVTNYTPALDVPIDDAEFSGGS